MPHDWAKKYPVFHEHVTKYQKKGKNTFDDAPDTLTGIVEMVNEEIKTKPKVSTFSRRLLGI